MKVTNLEHISGSKAVFLLLLLLLFWLLWGFGVVHGPSLVAGSGGYSQVAMSGLLIVVASLVGEYWLWDAWDRQLQHVGSFVMPCPPGSRAQ